MLFLDRVVRSSPPHSAVWLSAGIVSLGIALTFSGCNQAPSPEVLATVNGKQILAAEVARLYKQSLDASAPAPSPDRRTARRRCSEADG